jgi:transposase
MRILGHFLLHSGCGLKVARVARLLGISRPTASRQQGLSSKEAVQAAHHRMAGRRTGKLLPRYAGPVAQFLLTHPQASRYDVLDFLEATWDVRVSTVALHHFLKRYGLDRATRQAAAAPARIEVVETVLAGHPVPRPAPPFSWPTRSTPAPSC